MNYEIIAPDKNYLAANDYIEPILSPNERKLRDSYDDQLDEIVEISADNQQKLLDELLENVPKKLHAEIIYRFNNKLRNAQKYNIAENSLSEPQKQILSRLKKAEATMDLQLISKQSLRQLRYLFLHNPQLLDVVANLGLVLRNHGIAEVNRAKVAQAAATPSIQVGQKNMAR